MKFSATIFQFASISWRMLRRRSNRSSSTCDTLRTRSRNGVEEGAQRSHPGVGAGKEQRPDRGHRELGQPAVGGIDLGTRCMRAASRRACTSSRGSGIAACLPPPATLGDQVPAVPADVRETPQHSVRVPRDDDREPAQVGRRVRAGLGDVGGRADVVPVRREHAGALAHEERWVGVPARTEPTGRRASALARSVHDDWRTLHGDPIVLSRPRSLHSGCGDIAAVLVLDLRRFVSRRHRRRRARPCRSRVTTGPPGRPGHRAPALRGSSAGSTR